MRGQSQSPLRVIRGPKPVKPPQGARHSAVTEGLPFAPPEVPKAARIIISALLLTSEFIGQQAAQAEQARLQSERAEFALRRKNACPQLCQPLHRPGIVLVT